MSRDGQPGFPARYPSVCSRCGGDVLVGQRVLPRGDSYIHVGCASGQDDE